jgi:hypothetical protein
MHEDDRQRVTDAILRALDPASGGYYEIEYRITNPLTGVVTHGLRQGQSALQRRKQAHPFQWHPTGYH